MEMGDGEGRESGNITPGEFFCKPWRQYQGRNYKESSKNSGAEQTLPRKSDPSRNRTRSHSPGLHPEAQPRSMHMEAHEINTLARAWKIDYNYRRADRREKGVKPPADSHYHTERMEQQGKTASSMHTGTPTNHPAHDHGYGLQKRSHYKINVKGAQGHREYKPGDQGGQLPKGQKHERTGRHVQIGKNPTK